MFSQQSFLKVIWPLFLWTFSASAQNIDFYVTTPGSSEKETDADVVSNDAFKMICKYKATNKQSRLCEALWIYGSAEKRLAEFYSRDGTGRIGESYEAMAKTSMNVTYEISSEGTELRIELDVFRATKSLFDFPSYYCRCVNVNTAQGHVSLKIHEPTAPIKMKVYQEPSPPYLEGQIVKLSCSSEAWPSTTKYELEANQIPIYEKTENESLTGIEHQIKIDNAVHGNIECVATNKIGSSRKQFEVTIHVKANFFDCFDVQAAIGSEAKLVWKFDAFPLPTSTEIEVEKDGISLDHTQPHLAHSLQPVSESEASFELLVPVNSERDYGTYVLTVTNNAGSSQKSLLLNYTVNPLLPMLIDFKPISPKETLVVWHMREENLGGSTDFFQLKTWDTDSGDPEPLEEKIQSSSSEEVRDYSWKLTGLQRDRVYIVQLRSCNNQELCSPWSEEKVLNMSDPVMLGLLGGEQQVESARASAVLISFFVVIAVCALLLTAAALFISRRKCNEKKMKEERLASRSADGYASMPSRTVMRIPPPSPANTRSYSTLDWSNTYRPVLEFENQHPKTPVPPKKQTDAEIQTQSDPDLLEHINRVNKKPPLAFQNSSRKLSDGSNGGSSVGEYPPFMLTTPRKGGPVNDPNGLMYTFSPSGSYPFDHIDTTDADERVMQQQTPISPPLAGEDGEGEGDDEGDELEGAHHQDEYDDSPYSHLHHRVQSQHQPDHSSRSPYANTSPRGMFAANNSTTLSRTGKI